jgi:hypothetical protein
MRASATCRVVKRLQVMLSQRWGCLLFCDSFLSRLRLMESRSALRAAKAWQHVAQVTTPTSAYGTMPHSSRPLPMRTTQEGQALGTMGVQKNGHVTAHRQGIKARAPTGVWSGVIASLM